jgi:hypothetical protein
LRLCKFARSSAASRARRRWACNFLSDFLFGAIGPLGVFAAPYGCRQGGATLAAARGYRRASSLRSETLKTPEAARLARLETTMRIHN